MYNIVQVNTVFVTNGICSSTSLDQFMNGQMTGAIREMQHSHPMCTFRNNAIIKNRFDHCAMALGRVNRLKLVYVSRVLIDLK